MISLAPSITPTSLCERRRLIDVKGAAFLRGKSLRVMLRLAEGGARHGARHDVLESGLEWVWNVAVNPAGAQRELRFWPRELMAPKSCRGLKLSRVIDLLLPVKLDKFTPGHITGVLLCDYQHLYNLQAAGQLPPGGKISRAEIVAFLTKRLVSGHKKSPSDHKPPVEKL